MRMRTIVSCSAVVVVASMGSFFAGTIAGARTDRTMLGQSLAQKDMADAAVNVAALQRLRHGKIDEAIGLLETVLDGQIVILGTEPSEPRTTRQAAHILASIKSYRTEFPGGSASTDPQVRRRIDDVLTHVDQNVHDK